MNKKLLIIPATLSLIITACSSKNTQSDAHSSSYPSDFTSSIIDETLNNSSISVNKYTVTWLNDDGALLEIDKDVPEGSMPSYDGETPSKESSEEYDYRFINWDKDLEPVYCDITYVATYASDTRSYTVTWVVGNEKYEESYLFGQTPSCKNIPLERPNEGTNCFEFQTWDKPIERVTKNVTYTAVYAEYDGGNYYYTLSSETNMVDGQSVSDEYYSIVYYSGKDNSLFVPEFHKGIPIKSIDNEVLANCEEVILSNNVELYSFSENPSLRIGYSNRLLAKEIRLKTNNTKYLIEDGILFNADKTVLLSVLEDKNEIIIPNEVIYVNQHAFDRCSNISLLSIGSQTNYFCTNDGESFQLYNSINEIKVDSANQRFKVVDDCLIDEKTHKVVWFSPNKTGEYIVPEGILGFSDYFDTKCKICSLVLPSTFSSFQISLYNFPYLENLDLGTWTGHIYSSYLPSHLNNILVSSNNSTYSSLGGVLYDKDITKIIAFPPAKSGDFVLPDSVEEIDSNAFIGCSKLTSLTLGEKTKYVWRLPRDDGGKIYDIPIIIPPGNSFFVEQDGITYNAVSKTVLKCSADELPEDVHILEGVLNLSVSLNTFGEQPNTKTKRICLPKSLQYISSVFFDFNLFPNLEEIIVDEDNPFFSSIDGVLYNKEKTELCAVPYAKKAIDIKTSNLSLNGVDSTQPNPNLINRYAHLIINLDKDSSFDNPVYLSCFNEVIVDSDNPYYTVVDGVVYDNEITTLLAVPRGFTHELIIPDTVTSLGDWTKNGVIRQYNSACTNKLTIGKACKLDTSFFAYINYFDELIVNKDNAYYKVENDALVSQDNTVFYRLLNSFKTSKYLLPSTIATISDYAFKDSLSLTDIQIPSSVTSIGEGSFDGCSSLTSVVLPENIASIKTLTFSHCISLESISIPSSVSSIDSYAFSNCSSLMSISFPNNVFNIGNEAFSNCARLKEIIIESNTYFASDVHFGNIFLYDFNIERIVIEQSNSPYMFDNGCLYDKENAKLLWCLPNYFGNLIIPNTITAIDDWAFTSCGIDSPLMVYIHKNVQAVGEIYHYPGKDKLVFLCEDKMETISKNKDWSDHWNEYNFSYGNRNRAKTYYEVELP